MKNKLELSNILTSLKKKYNTDFIDKLIALPKGGVFLFGGPIRDMILGREMKEADIRVTLNQPWNLRENAIQKALAGIKILEKTRIKPIGLTIYRFLPRGSKTKYEVDLSLTPTLSQNKPDFTINGIFVNLATGEIIDKYQGIKDIKTKTLRTVKKPSNQFYEEPQMIFRAVKCICQFRLTPEINTLRAMKRYSDRVAITLEFISKTRSGILPELFLGNIFRGLIYDAHKYFKFFAKTGILDSFTKFLAEKTELNLKLNKIHKNIYPKNNGSSYEYKISLLLSYMTNQLDSLDSKKVFNQIRHILTLDEPKRYSDLTINQSQIRYIK